VPFLIEVVDPLAAAGYLALLSAAVALCLWGLRSAVGWRRRAGWSLSTAWALVLALGVASGQYEARGLLLLSLVGSLVCSLGLVLWSLTFRAGRWIACGLLASVLLPEALER
jgi:hypothetical protein